jgi:predicted transcriptional regulator of viral defense system
MSKVLEALWKIVVPRSPVFTTAEAARASRISVDQASRDLGKLATRKLIVRVVPGVWDATTDSRYSPYAVVPALLRLTAPGARGYVSLLSALSLHGMIQQVPKAIHVIVSRRTRPVRRTPVATYRFYVMSLPLVDGYVSYETRTFEIATPEKAVFDVLYLSARKGTRFLHLPELDLPNGFSVRKLSAWIEKIPYPPLRLAVSHRWRNLRETLASDRLAHAVR